MHDTSSDFLALVVPCFNEATRWPENYWNEVCLINNLKLCFVNDGSFDETSNKIRFVIQGTRHTLLELPKNVGKAEAVRVGMNLMLKETPAGIGYLDADGAFSIDDIENLILVFNNRKTLTLNNSSSIWSSRVKLAGRRIDRKVSRHFFSRLLSTFLSLRFQFSIHDTQSGMKIFPNSKEFKDCIQNPFLTRWFIDLEIFLRWRNYNRTDLPVWEEPLLFWKEVDGSKLVGKQYLAIFKDLFLLNRYM